MPLSLLTSAGNEQIDQITLGVIEIFEAVFPQRIRSYYYEGSCADGGLTSLSDIDLTLVFIDRQTPEERARFNELRLACKRISPRGLDISYLDEAVMLQADQLRFQTDWEPVLGAVTLKYASIPVYGTDIRDAVPLVPHDVYRRTMMHFPYRVLAAQRNQHITYPLDYPDPADEFFGYTARRLRGPDGRGTPSTKRLVHASGFIATALMALQTSEYIANKRTATFRYQALHNDRWAEHLSAVHTYCRVQWDYRVPEAPAERTLLRRLCEAELAFENYFLTQYRAYLLEEQHSADDAARTLAMERLALWRSLPEA